MAVRNPNRALPAGEVDALLAQQYPQFREVIDETVRTGKPHWHPVQFGNHTNAIYYEYVGDWVWITFDKRPPAQVRRFLGTIGFHFNDKRGVWQHPCGHWSKRSPEDPHLKYGSSAPADFPLADALTDENIRAVA